MRLQPGNNIALAGAKNRKLKSFPIIGAFVTVFISVSVGILVSVACAPALFFFSHIQKSSTEENELKFRQKATEGAGGGGRGALQCSLFRVRPEKLESFHSFHPSQKIQKQKTEIGLYWSVSAVTLGDEISTIQVQCDL